MAQVRRKIHKVNEESKKELRAVIYYRVSTTASDLRSQKHALPQLAKQKDYRVVDTFEEKISGKRDVDRPEFQRMLTEIEKGKYDVLMVTESSRLSRTEKKQEWGLFVDLCEEHNLVLCTEKQEIDFSLEDSDLFSFLEHKYAAKERKRILERHKRGRIAKLARGEWCFGVPPYGLMKDNRIEKGKVIEHRVVKNPPEVEVLEIVYDLLLNRGMSLADVAVELNNRNKPTRNKKRWNNNSLNYILRNEGALTGKKVITIDGVGYPAKSPPIFTVAQYKKIRKAIKKHTTAIDRKGIDQFLFRRRIQ